ncbi:multidrug efflux system transcriptional regulator CmeR [Campylobacter coli]|uniref:multidrug efflux system transcriptional regulator CmeR n=1 Tax=Campylobacter coli TaxID=195 RepID=UPI00092FCCBF|nr:multidrug efflux system transcriptional regulator CmeR [Campylobacter coli]EAJ2845284.1 multidrug efflux system transcriptional regulator CmeR [Campylobacter coli]EII8775711.1 multidrug efflux system transcriptional regulator CmeR [Campylobacter coli]HEB7544655.1 multidrug efflux system transcriptional regulator CmeR [Campylobacter coli]HEB7552456.1 multidrug efflux system transcriptional regulator CmeR [Campylobacter coli]HEH5404181.1 multidrug efflux system transcriptional regulator CmeR 
MNPNKTPSKKVLARREKIKNVAFDLFLTKGFQETSLSDIIKLSGGSYSNIYDSFNSKEGLFFEILDDVCKKHFDLIASQTQTIKDKNLKEFLTSFGLTFVDIFNQVQTVAFGKIIFSQVYDKHKHVKNWIENNQKIFSYSILIELFKKQDSSYISNNAQKLAMLFSAMLREPYHSLNVLADTPLMNKQEQKEHVEFIVNIFLKGIENKTSI